LCERLPDRLLLRSNSLCRASAVPSISDERTHLRRRIHLRAFTDLGNLAQLVRIYKADPGRGQNEARLANVLPHLPTSG
jgi:hypothetical protein